MSKTRRTIKKISRIIKITVERAKLLKRRIRGRVAILSPMFQALSRIVPS